MYEDLKEPSKINDKLLIFANNHGFTYNQLMILENFNFDDNNKNYNILNESKAK